MRNSHSLNAEAEQAERSGIDIRIRRLAREAGLTSLDVELLMISLLPDLDSRFERLYGYLNDDVTRRRASVGLALQLAGASGLSAAARSRLEPSRPLVRQGLVLVEDLSADADSRACGCRIGSSPICSAMMRRTPSWPD